MRNRLTLIAAAILVATSAAAAERTGFYVGGDLGQANWDTFHKQDAKDLIYVFDDLGFLYPGAAGVDVTGHPQKGKLEDTDFSYSLFVGYQFLPWLAAEGAWTDLGKTTIKASGDFDYLYIGKPPIGAPLGGSYSANADIKSTGWALSVLPMWPIGDWDLYARLGYFWGNNKLHFGGSAQDSSTFSPYGGHGSQSDNDGGFLWGLGGQWTWDQRVSVRLEYSQVVDLINLGGDKSSVDRYTLGVVYRFGQ